MILDILLDFLASVFHVDRKARQESLTSQPAERREFPAGWVIVGLVLVTTLGVWAAIR